MEFHVADHPDPRDIEVLEARIRREASAAMGLGDEVDLAIFVRNAGTIVAGISGWTWGDCCELQNLWVEPSLRGRGLATQLLAAAEAEAAARGCSQTVHFTYDFQARSLYERNGYELVGRVEDFPSGTDVLWYRKRLNPPEFPPSRERFRFDDAAVEQESQTVIAEVPDSVRSSPDFLALAFDRLGRAVRGACGVEVGKELSPPGAQGAAESRDLGDRAAGALSRTWRARRRPSAELGAW